MNEEHTSKLPIKLHKAQRDALEEVATERDTTATALLRDIVAALTGVPDPLPRAGQRHNRPRKKVVSALPIKFHRSQRDALEKIAIERNVTATALLRDNIESLTGVADPLPRYPRRDGLGMTY